jgi:predicted NAD/FAD-binding protein
VIGTGIAGLSAAYGLRPAHEVHLFERNAYAGGHSNTIHYREQDRALDLDTGFLVHNPRNYPNLIRLFEGLGVETQESEMSFSVRCHRCDLEYRGSDASTIFAQRRNWVRPSVYLMLRDLFRFFRDAPRVLEAGSPYARATLRQLVTDRGYGRAFQAHFLAPFCAAIWSAPTGEALDMPAVFAIQFFQNHALLGRHGAPIWRSMVGGSQRYVAAITSLFPGRVYLDRPVLSVRRTERGVRIVDAAGTATSFDAVVIGAHADEALALLEDPSDDERTILGQFRYTPNHAVLHYDADALPRREKCRAAWNYELEDCRADAPDVSLTYSLNRLQQIDSRHEYCVSLNRTRPIDPAKTIRHIDYTHPKYTMASFEAQQQLPRINGQRRTWFCGAYFGYGFHEDGHVAGLEVARKLGGG